MSPAQRNHYLLARREESMPKSNEHNECICTYINKLFTMTRRRAMKLQGDRSSRAWMNCGCTHWQSVHVPLFSVNQRGVVAIPTQKHGDCPPRSTRHSKQLASLALLTYKKLQVIKKNTRLFRKENDFRVNSDNIYQYFHPKHISNCIHAIKRWNIR